MSVLYEILLCSNQVTETGRAYMKHINDNKQDRQHVHNVTLRFVRLTLKLHAYPNSPCIILYEGRPLMAI